MIRDIVMAPIKPAEFDRHARPRRRPRQPISHDGRFADQFIAVKARWLLRREPAEEGGPVLDYGCGPAIFCACWRAGCAGGLHRLRRVEWHAGQSLRWPSAPVCRGARHQTARAHRRPAIRCRHHQRRTTCRGSAATEAWPVLKPGGRIYVFEHNPRNPLVRHGSPARRSTRTPFCSEKGCARLLDTARYDSI
jgi:hypothetical protein